MVKSAEPLSGDSLLLIFVVQLPMASDDGAERYRGWEFNLGLNVCTWTDDQEVQAGAGGNRKAYSLDKGL
jgi:hypothetical protein